MIIKKPKYALEELIYHSYPALCLGLIGLLIGYDFFYTTDISLAWQWCIVLFVAAIGFYIGHRINQKFLYNDYKIGHELENFCFVILFILTSIIISASLQHNFDLLAPYALIAVLILPAVFYYAARATRTISTGHLCFGIIIMALLSGFIPIALMVFGGKLYFLLPAEAQILWQKPSMLLSAYQQYLPFISIGLLLLILYIITPFYLRERILYRESKERFARFATLIQLLILPIYFSLLGQYSHNIDGYYHFLFFIISLIICFGVYSIIIRKRQWLNNANLLTKDIISPIVLAGILVFLKLPNINISSADIFMGITDGVAPISYFNYLMLPDMPANSDLLSYLPILLAQLFSLFGGEVDYQTLLPFTFVLIHTLC